MPGSDTTRATIDVPEAARVVRLPVCLRCGHVGKHAGGTSVSFSCTGPPTKLHKRTKMTMVTYEVQSVDDVA